jgi:hypothetical protein
MGCIVVDSQSLPGTTGSTTISDQSFETVTIEFERYVAIEIHTTENSKVSLEEKRYGEYDQSYKIVSRIIDNELVITDELNPGFLLLQDKLSAHKSFNARAIIYLPENKSVFIKMREGLLECKGFFKDLTIDMHRGAVHLHELTGFIGITTINADVKATDIVNYTVQANSANGKVRIAGNDKDGLHLLQIKSLNGDISVN